MNDGAVFPHTLAGDVFELKDLLHSLPRRAPNHPVTLRQGLLRGAPQVKLELGRFVLILEVC